MRVRLISCVSALTLSFVLAACGGGSEVGEDIDTSKLEGSGGTRLGETTTTAAPASTAPPTTARGATTTAAAAAPTTTAARATTTTAAANAFTIAIHADTAGGSQFEPRVARVRVGTVVRWENKDTVARSVEADDGSFRSPSLPAGGTWEYRPSKAGNVNYHDGTRPYAVGSLEVV